MTLLLLLLLLTGTNTFYTADHPKRNTKKDKRYQIQIFWTNSIKHKCESIEITAPSDLHNTEQSVFCVDYNK